MNQQDLENRLDEAVEHCASPDLLNRIMSEVKGVDEPMKQTNTVSMPRRKRRFMPAVAAAAVVLCGALAGWQLHTAAPAARVALDVNPSVELTLDKNDQLLKAIPCNADAKALLDGMKLEELPVDEAVDVLVDALQQSGYLSSENGTVLISVDAKGGHGEQLQQQLSEAVRQALNDRELPSNVLSQQVDATSALNRQAQEWDTSFGRAAYYQKVAQSANLDSNQLAGLTVQEAEYLLSSRGLTMADAGVECEVDDDLTTQDLVGKNLLSADRALELALSAAGISADAAQHREVELDVDKGRLIYEVEFRANGQEYEITMDAETGEILSRKSEALDADDLQDDDDHDDSYEQNDSDDRNDHSGHNEYDDPDDDDWDDSFDPDDRNDMD